MYAHTKAVLFLLAGLFVSISGWASNPESFIYSGTLMDLNGVPSSGNVNVRLQIYNPNGDCLLYDEMQTVDLTATVGKLNLSVGSAIGAAKRSGSDPGLAMTAIFSNPATSLRPVSSPNCPAGYTPLNGDIRKLRVSVIDGNGTDVLTPDQTLASAPFALTANSLQGKQPGDFIQVNSTAGYMLNQANINQIFTTSNFTRLVNLLNGTGSFDMANQRLTSVAMPAAGSDAANKSYVDTYVAGASIGAAPANGQVLTFNGAQWIPVDLAQHARVPASPCTAAQASRWDGTTWSCIAVAGGGAAGGAGSVTLSNNTVALSVASEKVQLISATTAGGIRLPDATAYSQAGGPVFQFLNSSGIPIPVIDFDGNFVGQVPASSGADVFLINFATAAGKWAMNSAAPYSAVALKLETLASENGTYAQYTSTAANTLVMSYYANNTSPYDLKLRGINSNFSTQTSTLGAAVTVQTGFSNPYSAQQRLLSMGSGTGVLLLDESGTKTGYPFTQAGSSVTLGTAVSLTSCTNLYQIAPTTDGFICTDATNSYKYNTAGVLVNSVAGVPQVGVATKIAGYDLIAYCDNSSPSQLTLAAVDFTDATPANRLKSSLTVSSPNNCSLSATDSYFQKNSFVNVDTNNVWFLFETTTQKVKITWSGGNLTVGQAASSLNGSTNAVSLSVGGQQYITAGSGSSSKNQITNTNTMTLGPASPSTSCYGFKPTVSGCLDVQQNGTNTTINHNVGF